MNYSRRKFLHQSAAAAAGAAFTLPSISAIGKDWKKISPNDKIQFGVIGCNGMGWSNTFSLLKNKEVECIAVCDVDQSVVKKRADFLAKKNGKAPQTSKDYRELIENKDLDAVVIGTPDHWHCMPMVDAVMAGKHVYVEKPISNTIEECNLMLAAAKKSGRIVQVGQWQRSGEHYAKAIEIVRSGTLGNIRVVKVWAYQGWMKPIPVKPNAAVPDGVDYDMWLGPAPKRAFNPNRFHFNFRWFWDYAGGLMTDWGVHEIDIALYAMEAIAPISVMASGGKLAYPDDASETPDTLQTVFQYEGFNMLWEHATGIDNGPYGRTEGIAFVGNNGTLVVNRDGYEVIAEHERKGWSGKGDAKTESISLVKRPKNLNYLDVHTKNFITAMQANDISLLNTPIESGSVAAINAQMGNIAYKIGQKVYWDKEKGQFTNNDAANALITAKYHNGWKLPEV